MADDPEDDTFKTTLTLNERTEEWLMKAYPDALNLQEAIRSAIADSRTIRDGDDDRR
jgi:hypothetical protein